MMNKQVFELVKKNYLSPAHPTSFSGIQKVYDFYKGKVSLAQIKKILSHIDSYTLHKEYKKLSTNPIYVNYARNQMQMDIAYVDHLQADNDGYKYLLICIDCFTKFAFVRALKTKTGPETLLNFQSILKQANKKPETILVDRGAEFANQGFQNYCRLQGIKLINNYTSVHAPIAERFIRSLKQIVSKYLTANNSKRYIDQLQNLVKTYNVRKHRSIQMSPYQAEKPSSALSVRTALSKYRQNIKRKLPKLGIGQRVRIAYSKNKFSRGHDQKSSNEIFTIYAIKTKLPIPMYYLKDEKGEKIMGGFYSYELTSVYE